MVHSHVSRTSETKAVEIAFGNRIACCADRGAAPFARRMKLQVKMQSSRLCVAAPNNLPTVPKPLIPPSNVNKRQMPRPPFW